MTLRFAGHRHVAILRTGCGHSVEHALGADVLIDIRPMDTLAAADNAEVGSLSRSRLRQAPRPRERNTDHTAIDKVGDDLVLGHPDAQDPRFAASHSGHAKPPE